MNKCKSAVPQLQFTITSIGQAVKQPGYSTEHGNNQLAILIYTLSGTGTLHMKQKSTALPPQSCFLLHCKEQQYHWTVSSKDSWFYYYINLEELIPESTFPCGSFQIAPEYFLKIFNQFQQYTPERHCSFQSNMNKLLSETLKELPSIPCTPPIDSSLPVNANIMPSVAYIRENYATRITTERLAQECHLSKYYFIHSFKDTFKETPYQYLTRYRIDMAKQLLTDEALPLNNIALMVGYDNYSNFLVHFKKLTNITPTQYREQYLDTANAAAAVY